MGGMISGPFDGNGMQSQTITTGGYWPDGYGNAWPITPSIYYYHTYPVTPVECSGDVHVFPCPHCEKCKCGKATVKREKRKG